jgi:prepilin-type N-terminal cleavage/methylation domain-containing protein/prepilin-type processing-associated H-X9-DG protein
MTITRRTRSGFTLIELLVFIAIFVILTGILFPVFAQARQKAQQTVCLSNLRQIGTAFTLYTQDYDDLLPYEYRSQEDDAGTPIRQWWWEDDISPYLTSYQLYRCPAALLPVSYTTGRGQPDFQQKWPNPLITTYFVNSARWNFPENPCSQFKRSGTCNPPTFENEGDSADVPALASIEDPVGTILVSEGWTMEIWRVEETVAWHGRPGAVQPYDSAAPNTLQGRHFGFNNLLFVDGHVRAVRTMGTTPGMWTREAD